MQIHWPEISQSVALRNVGKLLSANVLAQAIGLLIYPLLTRLYAPEDFGLMNLFVSIGGVFVMLATLDWNKAIVLPKREEDARALLQVCLATIGLVVLVLALSIPFCRGIAGLFKSPKLADYYWLLPFYVLLTSVWNVLNYWYIRHKEYGRISGYQVSQSLFSAGTKTGFGFMGWLSGGMIFASIVSPLCSLIVSLSLSAKKYKEAFRRCSLEDCRQVARTYINFPKFSFPHSLINYVASQLPVLLLTPFFSAREVGFWSMAFLLSFAPMSMISNALYQVLYQKTTEQVNARQSIAPFHRRFTIWSLALIVPFFAALWFILPALTQWLLGDEWRVSGEYIQWLLPWLLCVFLCASTGYLFDIFSKQKHGLIFEIIIALARLIGLGIGIYCHSFVTAIACYAIASALVNGAQYVWLMSLVKKYEDSLTRSE